MAQISLALLLLAGAGLLVKTVVRWAAHDPGFDPARVLEGDVSLPASAYATPASINAFASGLMERLTGLPNTRAGIQRVVFFAGFGAQARQVTVEGTASVPEGASPSFYFAVTPGFFLMLGAPLTEGREFGPYDGSDVAIVNQAMARAIWGSASPLGRRIRFGDRPWRTVVGVAGNINGGIRPYPSAYVPFSSEPGPDLAVMISTSGNPSSLAGDLRAAVRAIDSDQPIESVMTLAAMRREQSAPSRYVALLMSALSIVAVGLASVGLYGVTAYAVRRRLRECGVRIALGATASDIVRLIVGSTWRMIAPGLLLGIGAAWAGTRALRGILFGTSPTDPAVFATTVVILAAVASFASYLPARRAARVDPMAALRDA